jgi:hypothetical protein
MVFADLAVLLDLRTGPCDIGLLALHMIHSGQLGMAGLLHGLTYVLLKVDRCIYLYHIDSCILQLQSILTFSNNTQSQVTPHVPLRAKPANISRFQRNL